MVTNDPLVVTNVVACAAIVLRLMMFRKPGGRHNPWASWLAYLIILAYASVPFRYLFDSYLHTHWATVAINLIICAAVFRARGNVARIFHVLRPE
ncbi:phage holin family protein [Atlantibacter subterranea]|uniref:Phage holin family protein n=1 Tax=Atlantibacter subterraneus TaxID=255519 RepID=A0A3R9EM37_9ENTR|nr:MULTISPECIES: phage holin family protein [Atlantibacter]QFH71196.1 phage holin family protein [Enterobacter sp. E76]MCZ7836051.1 phage holin family protein [Atlantibacter hermannii]MDA3133586.1 phage holin family protein [Atlantibacter subterranea]MDU1952003.1 phage holin family protein [Atlantibacter hermannii]MDV7023724.1 phage holin family protein [Atlantibacter subterranea]